MVLYGERITVTDNCMGDISVCQLQVIYTHKSQYFAVGIFHFYVNHACNCDALRTDLEGFHLHFKWPKLV